MIYEKIWVVLPLAHILYLKQIAQTLPMVSKLNLQKKLEAASCLTLFNLAFKNNIETRQLAYITRIKHGHTNYLAYVKRILTQRKFEKIHDTSKVWPLKLRNSILDAIYVL